MSGAGDIPVIYINLEDARARRARIETALGAVGLRFERFEAVAGAALSAAEIAAACPDPALWWRRGPLSRGEIGCYLSHLGALDRVAAGDEPAVCILEDDIAVNDRLARVLKGIDLPEGVGILKLEGSTGLLPRSVRPVGRFGSATIGFSALPRWRAGAYVVTREAARTLVRRIGVVDAPFDQSLYDMWRTDVPVVELLPFPVRQDGADSDIDRAGDSGVRRRDPREALLQAKRMVQGHIWVRRNAARLDAIFAGQPRDWSRAGGAAAA